MSEQANDNKLERIRHSASHVMAQAVLEMFPEGKIAIGPAIQDGFPLMISFIRASMCCRSSGVRGRGRSKS